MRFFLLFLFFLFLSFYDLLYCIIILLSYFYLNFLLKVRFFNVFFREDNRNVRMNWLEWSFELTDWLFIFCMWYGSLNVYMQWKNYFIFIWWLMFQYLTRWIIFEYWLFFVDWLQLLDKSSGWAFNWKIGVDLYTN